MGLCALVLCATPVAAHAGSENLATRLASHVATIRKDATVIRFFETHRWLLTDPRFKDEAAPRFEAARRHLALTQAKAKRTRALIALHQRQQLAQRLRSPAKAICHVFGSYCRQALQVARCESAYHTTAENGQYLGLFQMGSSERQLFGHGVTALQQAKAAYRYFVRSGRDWSPWSCKPWS
jgi:hypothetical protein